MIRASVNFDRRITASVRASRGPDDLNPPTIGHLGYGTTQTCAITFLMSNYRRAFVSGGCWFFTVNLLERRKTLLVDHIALLREASRQRAKAIPL
jgi:hypothetical protein